MTTEQKLQEITELLDRAKELIQEAYEHHLLPDEDWPIPDRMEISRGPLNDITSAEKLLLPRDMKGNLFEGG